MAWAQAQLNSRFYVKVEAFEAETLRARSAWAAGFISVVFVELLVKGKNRKR